MSVGSIASSPATLANLRTLNAAQVTSSGATNGSTNERITSGKPVASQPSESYVISPSALGPGLATVSLNSVLQLQSNTGTAASSKDDFALRQLIASNAMADAKRSVINYLADADMAKEGAQKKALQTRQQLGTQALSIANQAPQSLLSLFSA